jgi:beta-lactamase regulating signal transducer with metallopeptidase domain/tetratricopeptide (TPR) repeat protein
VFSRAFCGQWISNNLVKQVLTMNTFDLSRWLWDFYSWATVLLSVALVANFLIAQPARRMVIAWSTAWALLALALLTAVPNWSQYSLVATQQPKQVEVPESQSAPNAPPNFEQQSQQPQQQIAFPPPNMAAVEAAPPNVVTIDWSALVMTALVVGSSVVMCWLALGAWQVRRLCASASPAPDEIKRLIADLSQGKQPVSQLGISQNLPVAVAVGLAKPWILLPQTLTKANREQARSVLAHELAHVANRDLWLLAMLRGLMILLWPHPLFWLLRRQVRLDQELLADAAAAELTSRGTYAEQLVALARSAVDSRVPRLASSVGLWERPSQLKERIALLLDDKLTILRNCSRGWRIGSAGMLAVLALALSLVTLAPRAAESRADTETATIQLASSVPPEQFAELVKQAETKDGFAYAVGDLVAAAIKPSQLPFVSDKRLAAIRYDFVMFVNQHTPANITTERKADLLEGLRDHAQQHMQLWNKPVTEDRDLNNFYLNFNDLIKTLKWELWMALTRAPLDKESLAKRDIQRIWMRKTILDQPKHRHYTHSKVLEELEATFADPLCVIFDRPMSDEAITKFQTEINNWLAGIPKPNGIRTEKDPPLPTVDSQLPYMVHHLMWEAMRAQYSGEQGRNLFPQFDEDEIGGYGADSRAIHLGFASNRANVSSSLSLSGFEKTGNAINADTGYMADSTVKGDFAFTERDMKMISLNGAKLLPLQVANWIEADQISVEDLKSRLTNSGVDEVDLEAFLQLKRDQFEELKHDRLKKPPFILAQNLEERMSASKIYAQNLKEVKSALEAMQDGEGPYIAVLTNEGNIAVAHLTDLRGKNYGSFYVRTRVRPKPVTDETVGEINAQAGPVAQVGKTLEEREAEALKQLQEAEKRRAESERIIHEHMVERYSGFFEAAGDDEQKLKNLYVGRGNSYAHLGRDAEAVADFEAALRLDPDNYLLMNRLASHLAASPDDAARNGERAVELASRTVKHYRSLEQDNHNKWLLTEALDTLASAYAEMGQFDLAVYTQDEAIKLAGAAREQDYRGRLELYMKRQPARENAFGPAKQDLKPDKPADSKTSEEPDDQTSWWIRPALQSKKLAMGYSFRFPSQRNAAYEDAIFSD